MEFPNLKNLKDKLKVGGGGQKQTLIIMAVGCLVILALYFYLLFRPAMANLKDLMPKVARKSAELNKALRDIDNRLSMEKNKESLESKIYHYEKKLPTEKEIPKLLERLSDMAAESDVKIIMIKPAKVTEEGAEKGIYQAQPINIEARCGYHELGRFLQDLETGGRIMKVSDIEIAEDAKSETVHNVKLTVITYTLTRER